MLPHHEHDDQPPPYSSVVGLPPQGYVPYTVGAQTDPQTPYRMPMPMSMPMPMPMSMQDTTPYYDPTRRVMTENGKFVSERLPARLAPFDHMDDTPAVNNEVTSDQAAIVPTRIEEAAMGPDICGYFKMFLAIGFVLIALGVGLHIYTRLQYNKARAQEISKGTSSWQVESSNNYKDQFKNTDFHFNGDYFGSISPTDSYSKGFDREFFGFKLNPGSYRRRRQISSDQFHKLRQIFR